MNTHDPAITFLVEEAAELRHREVMGQTELEAKKRCCIRRGRKLRGQRR